MSNRAAFVFASSLALSLAAWTVAAVAQPDPQPQPPPPVEDTFPIDPGSAPPIESGPLPPVEMPVTPEPFTPPPPEVIVPAPPSSAPPVAVGVVLGGLDKVAARTAKFEVNLKQQVFYNTLIITAQMCKTRPPEEPPESAAFLEVQERKSDGTIQKIFSGWMFASSPALNALEHPVYDVWVVSCKTVPTQAAAPAPPNS
jgi:hypothetical protein